MMKPVLKMGVIALVGICVVFYQYHLSFGTRLDQIGGLNGAAPPVQDGSDAISINSETYACNTRQKITEDMASLLEY